jgi:hypothetical protein
LALPGCSSALPGSLRRPLDPCSLSAFTSTSFRRRVCRSCCSRSAADP